MIDDLEALAALAQTGTVSEAAARLRLTQSAVSKRIQALQRVVGFPLVEPEGRRLRLTARGVELVERARPLVAELRALTRPAAGPSTARLSLALADSIASSWGPELVRGALAEIPGLTIDLHAHRSVLVIENVRLGRYHAGLCTAPQGARDLVEHPVVVEPLVLVHSALSPKADRRRPFITIEPTSATFRAVEASLERHHPELLGSRLVPVESFGAVLQMVKAGFGDGLLPLGLALEARLPERAYRALPGVERHISLVTRKTVDQLPAFHKLHEHLARQAARRLKAT